MLIWKFVEPQLQMAKIKMNKGEIFYLSFVIQIEKFDQNFALYFQ
jgi:hypothetical protein